VKNSVPFTFVSELGFELALPGLISLINTVPAAVPSLFHNSAPFTPSSAVKYAVEPIDTIAAGLEPSVFPFMSRTICGVSDGVRRSSSASRMRRSRRGRTCETRPVCLARRTELYQRRQNEVFIGRFSVHKWGAPGAG